MFCKNCGNKLSLADKFCDNCGNTISKDSQKTFNAPSKIVAPIVAVQNSPREGLFDGKNEKVEQPIVPSPSSKTVVSNGDLIKIARKAAVRMMLIGLGLCILGLIISWITYSLADGGGTYFVLWGLIVFGGFNFIKGLYFFILPRQMIKSESK